MASLWCADLSWAVRPSFEFHGNALGFGSWNYALRLKALRGLFCFLTIPVQAYCGSVLSKPNARSCIAWRCRSLHQHHLHHHYHQQRYSSFGDNKRSSRSRKSLSSGRRQTASAQKVVAAEAIHFVC